MGSLNALGIRLEEYRSLLADIRQTPDLDMHVAMRIRTEWPDDLVIRLAHTRREMSFDYTGTKQTTAEPIDLLWAIDFLDFLDTMGLAVRPKRTIALGRKKKATESDNE